MKYILIVVFLLIIATLYFVFIPEQAHIAGKPDSPVQENIQQETSEASSEPESKSEEELRREAMHETFEKLEKARRDLERKLSRLKALLWGLEFPAEKSEAIREQMQTGYALLKNKKLLGAYRDLEHLKEDLDQIGFVYQSLVQLEEEVRKIKDSKRKQSG